MAAYARVSHDDLVLTAREFAAAPSACIAWDLGVEHTVNSILRSYLINVMLLELQAHPEGLLAGELPIEDRQLSARPRSCVKEPAISVHGACIGPLQRVDQPHPHARPVRAPHQGAVVVRRPSHALQPKESKDTHVWRQLAR